MDNRPYLQRMRHIKVVNQSGETAPAFAVMKVVDATQEDLVAIEKPDANGPGNYIFNGPLELQNGATGIGYHEFPCQAAYDTGDGTPINGETWGPAADEWVLKKNIDGYSIWGEVANDTCVVVPKTWQGAGDPAESGYVRFTSQSKSLLYPDLYAGQHAVFSFDASGVPTPTTKLVWIYYVNNRIPTTGIAYDAQIAYDQQQLRGRYIYTTDGTGHCCDDIDDDETCEENYCWNPFIKACVCCHPDCCVTDGYDCWNSVFGVCAEGEDDCPPSSPCTSGYPCTAPRADWTMTTSDGDFTWDWDGGLEHWELSMPGTACDADATFIGVLSATCTAGEYVWTIDQPLSGATKCDPYLTITLFQCDPVYIEGYIEWVQYPGPGAPTCTCDGTVQPFIINGP